MIAQSPSTIRVTKRAGTVEPLDIDKIHKVVEFACDGLAKVSASELELRSQLHLHDKISSKSIQETLIRAAHDMISEETPNYQYVAGRLVTYAVRKEVYGGYEPSTLEEHIRKVTAAGFYDPAILESYTTEEMIELDRAIEHGRDEEFTYASMEQWRTKYLVRNRYTGQILESPSMAYMVMAMTGFMAEPASVRLGLVKAFYEATRRFSLPTPIMAGLRTPQRQFSSCVLVEADDSLDSINATAAAIVKYVSQKAGIGVGVGRIRGVGSAIRNGDATHTGIIPFIKHFYSAVASCSQGGVRKGSATAFFPLWHIEIEDLIVLKNNKGTEESRVRHMDYGVQLNKLLYQRLISAGSITLFSPKDVPGLYEAFFADQEKFKALYEAAEKNKSIRKKVVPAQELFAKLMGERKDTGRIYIQHVDHANDHSPFKADIAPIRQSNLCVGGDTVVTIQRADGQVEDIAIQDLAYDVFANGTKVKSRNLATGLDEFKNIMMWAKTSPSAEVLRITDEATGASVVCTPDHKVYTRNRGWVRAGDLEASDELVTDVGS